MLRLASVLLLVATTASASPCEREAHRWNHWKWGWSAVYAGVTLGQLGVIAAHYNPFGAYDHNYRWSLYVGAAQSGVSSIGMALAPSFDETDCAKNGPMERTIFYQSHVANLVINLAGSAVLAKEANWSSALIAFGVGYAVGLLNTYTEPRDSWHALVVPVDRGAALTFARAF
jgi:hypothetical protein